MDLTLVRTFLEVAASGSFAAASDRLYVTQSAVSLRVQRIEDALGKRLFDRSKAGAVLTPAGHEFEKYALSLLKVWEEARQRIGMPEGFSRSFSIGAQYSLWPRLGFRWVDGLRANMPDLGIRMELGMPDRLMRFLVEGSIQAALIYTPRLRPGLTCEKLMEDELVLVASWPDPTLDLAGRYAFVDWGEEFVHAHSQALPGLTHPGLTLSLEAMAADFVLNREVAAYLPARTIKKHVDAGRLHLVPDAPTFPYPLWVVWRDDLDPTIAEIARDTLTRVAETADRDQSAVIDDLRDISENSDIPVLGEVRDLIPE